MRDNLPPTRPGRAIHLLIGAVAVGLGTLAMATLPVYAAPDTTTRHAPMAAATVVTNSTGSIDSSTPTTSPAALAGSAGANAADERARQMLARMTQDEKLQMIRSAFGIPFADRGTVPPAGALGSAGYVAPIERLGIPALQESDAGLGVTNPGHGRADGSGTALPSSLAMAASWDPRIAFQGGQMIGREARSKGFNVMLAGGINLLREPRNGRNFEYAGEDPLLAGVLVGESIRGIQSQRVISTIKHFALNDQETGRTTIDVRLNRRAMHESDLLAFELAIQRGSPGSVMCAYNRVNADYACESDYLLNQVLKQTWAYPGFVMSDWGGVHSAIKAANAGLDQQSAGEAFDEKIWFDQPLREALQSGEVKQARLDDMVLRILRSMYAAGLFGEPMVRAPIDKAAGLEVARGTLEAGAVLLRNQRGLLPLNPAIKSVAVIGAYADKGVIAGGGSSAVGFETNAVPGLPPTNWPGPVVYHPSPPLAGVRQAAPAARVSFSDGNDIIAAAEAARAAQVVIVFVRKWAAESVDSRDLTLPDRQDKLIAAVARANPNTVVVLQTNGAVDMPWLQDVGAVLQAWYAGGAGGEAIANLLFGKVSPSGRLPLTWPRNLAQLPRPKISEVKRTDPPDPTTDFVDYNNEGADIGYRWYQRQGLSPLFPFGHGLTYTSFEHGKPRLIVGNGSGDVRVTVDVRNTGRRAGDDVVQVYVAPPEGRIRRLAGFAKISLAAGQSGSVDIRLEPRMYSRFDPVAQRWTLPEGRYQVYVGHSAEALSAPMVLEVGRKAR